MGEYESCLNNTKQIGLAVMMYAEDNAESFPNQWWAGGPYINSRGKTCGGEWQRTPAIQLTNYLKGSLSWVCPKKRRGLTYKTEPGSFDPALTGFLSSGFNYLGVFGGDSGKSFKASNVTQPTRLIAVTECNGTDDPKEIGGGIGNEKADAAWLDGYWAGGSFPNATAPKGNQNFRFQSQMKKHLKRVNVIYVDGHADSRKGSQLQWGQWYGVFSGTTIPNTPGVRWDGPCSNAALDASEIKPD